jgi:ornithine cyclodeaminase/alanine dehydrogenase-like protein (mu-crystallin family)
MLVLNSADVRKALPMSEAVEAMKQAFAALTDGKANVPMRAHLPITQHDGISLVMPAYLNSEQGEALTVKVVSLFDHNHKQGLSRIQAAVLVLNPETGQPVAVVEGATLTAIRTAAASGAATDLLANQDAHRLAIFGAGVQAPAHIEAMCAVRPILEVWIYAPTQSKVEDMIARISAQEWCTAELHVAASPGQAVADADIICTTTTSSEPVFDDADVKPGVHINAVGSYTPQAREIPPETVVRSLVVVDSREAAWEEAGDLIQPLEAGLIDRDHIHAELGELVLEQKTGRSRDDQITFFKSVGIAVQDAAATRVAMENAQHENLGSRVEW